MLMKDGTVVPKPLADALAVDTIALKVFMDMSPTYQKLCIAQITRSEESSMRKRVEAAIENIHRYGKNKGN